MKKQSKKPSKTVARPRHFCTPSEYVDLTYGLTDEKVGEMMRVSRSTARRWRLGITPVPWMAVELLKQRQGTVLPDAFGSFAGFTLEHGPVGHESRLIPPGAHWRSGITAYNVRCWQFIRDNLDVPWSRFKIDRDDTPRRRRSSPLLYRVIGRR